MSVITEISLSPKIRNLIKTNFNEIEDLDINKQTKEIVFHNSIEKTLKKEVEIFDINKNKIFFKYFFRKLLTFQLIRNTTLKRDGKKTFHVSIKLQMVIF